MQVGLEERVSNNLNPLYYSIDVQTNVKRLNKNLSVKLLPVVRNQESHYFEQEIDHSGKVLQELDRKKKQQNIRCSLSNDLLRQILANTQLQQ